MGVTGESSGRVAEHLSDRFFCIVPTSTVYCAEMLAAIINEGQLPNLPFTR